MYGPATADASHEPLPPLRSVHSSNLPAILDQLGISLAVTTYQAGKLVLVRADTNQHVINTHFRNFRQPMGLAVDSGRMAVGTEHEIIEFRDVPAAAQKLQPAGKHDACYLPRRAHVTNSVLIHEMAYCGDELWFVNTRFSCLCTLDCEHSFVPRWRPPFVTQLIPGDCCHLNGLGCFQTKPRWVTALGACDELDGWREQGEGRHSDRHRCQRGHHTWFIDAAFAALVR